MIFALFGPSGSGKTTLELAVAKQLPGFQRLVSTTTRAPRPGEVDGIDYHFVSRELFQSLELATSIGFSKDCYGFSQAEIDSKQRTSSHQVATVAVHGLRQLQARYPGQVFAVYLKPPGIAQAVERMRARGDSEEQIKGREADDAELWAAEGLADFVIKTRSPDQTFQEFVRLVRTHHSLVS